LPAGGSAMTSGLQASGPRNWSSEESPAGTPDVQQAHSDAQTWPNKGSLHPVRQGVFQPGVLHGRTA
jgi:hypothetical protein